jgi:hypothetical protein
MVPPAPSTWATDITDRMKHRFFSDSSKNIRQISAPDGVYTIGKAVHIKNTKTKNRADNVKNKLTHP